MNKLQHIKGDCIALVNNGEAHFVVHCCNTLGVMGAGIAKQVVNAWGEQANYKRLCKLHKSNFLGDIAIDNNAIALVAQLRVGTDQRQVNYGAMSKCLLRLAQETNKMFALNPNKEIVKVVIPKYMGCGLAGGDWEIIYELIQFYLEGRSWLQVTIVEYGQ